MGVIPLAEWISCIIGDEIAEFHGARKRFLGRQRSLLAHQLKRTCLGGSMAGEEVPEGVSLRHT